MNSVTIQELHGTTDEIVRRAGVSDVPKSGLGSMRGSLLRHDAPFEPAEDPNAWEVLRD
jgi:hypothetical protein